MPTIRKIDMDTETFADLKQQMTEIINGVLSNMQETGAESGKVTVTINIGLEEQTVDNNGLARTVVIPTFEHKVASAVQIKSERSGEVPGGCELVKGKGGVYELKQIATPLEELAEYGDD